MKSTCYQLFSIEKCVLSVVKAPAMLLCRSFPHRANKGHLSLTLRKVPTEHQLQKNIVFVGWDDSWYDVATSAVIVRNHSTLKPIVSEIKLENVWGGHKKQGHVWGRHQKQDLLRVQWRWGSCRSAVSYSSHTVTSISSSQYLSGPLKTTGTSYDLDGKFSFTKVNTSPVQGCFKLSMNSSPRSWSLVSWAARWRVCYICFIFYIKFYADVQ